MKGLQGTLPRAHKDPTGNNASSHEPDKKIHTSRAIRVEYAEDN